MSTNSDSLTQLWLMKSQADNTASAYHPAVLIECKLTFRNLRASIHHTEERNYTAWYPEAMLPVDWDRAAIELQSDMRLASAAPYQLPTKSGNFIFTSERITEMEEELIDRLERTEKLRLLYNPAFKLYSSPGQNRDDFLERVSEKALGELEPKLKELTRRFEMKLEQVREAEERKGRKEPREVLPALDLLKSIEKRSEPLISKARLTSLFLSSARLVLKPIHVSSTPLSSLENTNRELYETLCHIEQEVCDTVNQLCDQFLDDASQCDNFESGLQRKNIQVLRRALLWIPQ
ncbi:MAG: hypothetical protein AB1489_24490 [Acidobacteriota bacterium]